MTKSNVQILVRCKPGHGKFFPKLNGWYTNWQNITEDNRSRSTL